MRFIILDLEATCTDNRNIYFDNEVIEIGAVKIENKQVIDEFQSFVRPVVNTELTEFCKNLTSINQSDVDNAEIFPNVLDIFLNWCYDGITNKNDVLFCSWGFYDRHQLEKDCERYKINSNFISNHISLKHQFHYVDKKHTISTKGMSMTKALRILNIPLDGIHHRGIDDAKNIAKIFIKFYDDWKY